MHFWCLEESGNVQIEPLFFELTQYSDMHSLKQILQESDTEDAWTFSNIMYFDDLRVMTSSFSV